MPRETTPVVFMVPAPTQVGNKSKVFRPRSFHARTNATYREASRWRTMTVSTGSGSPAPSMVDIGSGAHHSTRLTLQVLTRALDNFLYLVDRRLQQESTKMVRVKITVMKRLRTCTVSARSSYEMVDIGCLRYGYTWLTIRRPQVVGCDDKDCPHQWVMSILVPCVPPVLPNSLSSSIWSASASKIPQVLVGTVLTVLLNVVRTPGGGHQASRKGKEGKVPWSLMFRSGLFCYHTCILYSYYLYHLINTSFFPDQDDMKHPLISWRMHIQW